MPSVVRQPKVTVNIANANETVQNTGQKILFIGQQTLGTAVAGELQETIANGGAEDALFGEDSMLATMIRANKVRNQSIRIDAIALDDDGGGTVATGSIDLVGTATENGTFEIIVGSSRNHKYEFAVQVGDTETTLTAAMQVVINADIKNGISVINVIGSLDFDSDHAGTWGNSIALSITGEVAGITHSVSPMTGGATDPDTTSVFDIVGDERYQAVVWPYPDSLTDVLAFLDPRFNADGKVLDGVAFTAKTDTFANLQTLADAENSENLVIFGTQLVTETSYAGPSIIEHPMVQSSIFTGYRALRMDSDGANIADLVITTNGQLDGRGGPALASKPYFNMGFPQLEPETTGRGFDDSQIEDLLDSGVSVIGTNITSTDVISGEIVTTYSTDVAGNPDISFKFLNFVDTSSQAREYFFNNLKARFAQSRLTEGDVIQGRDMANANTVRGFVRQLYQDLSGVDFVLMQAGADALAVFDDNLFITLDLAQGLVTIQSLNPIVTQIREIFMTMQITFSTNP